MKRLRESSKSRTIPAASSARTVVVVIERDGRGDPRVLVFPDGPTDPLPLLYAGPFLPSDDEVDEWREDPDVDLVECETVESAPEFVRLR